MIGGDEKLMPMPMVLFDGWACGKAIALVLDSMDEA
jgi:hypothetical protein